MTTTPALPPPPTEGITAAQDAAVAPNESAFPPDFDDWGGDYDPELSGLLYQVASHQKQIEYCEGLVSDARDRLMARLEELRTEKFECPIGVCQLAKNPGKVVLNEGINPAQLPDRFQKVAADTKAIRLALEMNYDVPASIKPPEQEYRLVVKLSK